MPIYSYKFSGREVLAANAGSAVIPGTLQVLGSMTGSLFGTASFTSNTNETLATVTARGASTSTATTFNANVTLGNTADLIFSDLAGTYPTSGKGFDWTLNNDGARIYAIQPASDSIDFVFQLRDNATTNDRFVFWVDDYTGPSGDKYPLIMRGGTEFDLVDSSLYVSGTLRLSNAGVLQNVTGNISMFTNNSGYVTSTNAFIQNGNSFGTTALLGTNDNNPLALETNGTTRMFISSSGDVGIGTASPAVRLDVQTTGTVQTSILGRGLDGNFRLTTRQDVSANTDGSVIGELGIDYTTNRNSAIRFHRGAGTTGGFISFTTDAGNERVRIDSTGNVGIGTTSIQGKFHVNQSTNLGGTAGNNLILQTLQNTGGSGGNNVYIKDYAYRDATGTDWTTWRHHNSIDIDGSHNTPRTNTRTYWERDPNADIHYLGSVTRDVLIVDASTNQRVGINIAPSYPLHVSGSVSNTSIYATHDIVAYSDASVKENIRPIENVIERIQQSRGVVYDRTDSNHKDNIGFIAQELEVAFPELVVTNEDGTKAVKYQNTVAVLFEAIKEQQKQIQELKQIINGITK